MPCQYHAHLSSQSREILVLKQSTVVAHVNCVIVTSGHVKFSTLPSHNISALPIHFREIMAYVKNCWKYRLLGENYVTLKLTVPVILSMPSWSTTHNKSNTQWKCSAIWSFLHSIKFIWTMWCKLDCQDSITSNYDVTCNSSVSCIMRNDVKRVSRKFRCSSLFNHEVLYSTSVQIISKVYTLARVNVFKFVRVSWLIFDV
jgi:hypothetical protein